MKLLLLPAKILLFWYPESLVVFIRVWKNCLLYLEEDLAVGLMWKLLFIPLFHDATLVGKVLSFCFRSLRIFLGIVAFMMATVAIFILAVWWFLLPVLAVVLPGIIGWITKAFAFGGVVLFTNHIISHPEKKIWQIKTAEEINKCSTINLKDITLAKLLTTSQVKDLLLYLEQTPDKFSQFVDGDGKLVLQQALQIGRQLKIPHLGPEHFFVAGLLTLPTIDKELLKLDLKSEDLIDALNFQKQKNARWRMVFVWDEDFQVRHLKGVNRGWLGIPTPNLDLVSEDLTRKATRENIPDFVGRVQVVSQVINILSQEKGRNVVIVGEPGSGKSELVLYLAKLIISGDAPQSFSTKRLARLDLTRLLSGIKTQGELAERIKNIFDEVKACGNIIIFVDEIHELGMGQVGADFNLYSLLLPFIEGSQIQFIATTEPQNYTKILEKNQNFAHLFIKIELPPASPADTLEILKNRAIDLERCQKIKTSLPALSALSELSYEYIHNQILPDSALKIYQECEVISYHGWITKSIVEKIIQQKTAIPVGEISEDSKVQLLNLENLIHQKVVDQKEAIDVVSSALRRAAAHLADKNRPIGSFLFVGPTGVGKTELAKILEQVYFQGKGGFLRFDMSEYQTPQAMDRLIGREGEEGQLTEAIQNHPHCLILLDEFEKADPKILTLFLQVLEDGRLTSGSGKLVDFTDCIIIATSNAASLTIASGLAQGRSLKELEGVVKDELMQIYKPELLNRFDEVVLFKPLSKEDLQKIVQLKLNDLKNNLKDQGFIVEFGLELIEKLAEKGFDPVLGARPLRRLIQDTLEARFSVMILEGKLHKGEKFIATSELLT